MECPVRYGLGSYRVENLLCFWGGFFVFVNGVMFSCLHFILYPVQNYNVININPSCHMTHVTCHMTNATKYNTGFLIKVTYFHI
jgi:hypothetical protein